MDVILPEIRFETQKGYQGDVGLITLTRPKALNALNHVMFVELKKQLDLWKNDQVIKAVIIQAGEGRAFCAGGDIRYVYEQRDEEKNALKKFFQDEYDLNALIHHYPKPYIALLNGITMGGGVGISWHGSHCVGTSNLIFAMPETGIGFYPDVGITYHLARLPHHIGLYLGLTGSRISFEDCAALGIVFNIVNPESLPSLIHAIRDAAISNKHDVSAVLDRFSAPYPSSELMQHAEEIDICFNQTTIEEIVEALNRHNSAWSNDVLLTLQSKSPTSLKVTLQALQRAKGLNFDECIQMEYALTCHFVEQQDFFEGIRAVIIDKDGEPLWQPATLERVTPEMINHYFS